jgi:hypothetical protein
LSRVGGADRARVVHRLQRQLGNTLVQRLLAGRSGPAVQRDLTDEQKKSWADNKGDAYVQELKAAVAEWKTFRSKPESFSDLPKAGSAPSGLAELLRTGDPAYRRYAADQLGGDAVKYLGEMAAFVPRFRLLTDVVPGIAYTDPAHKYRLTSDQSSFWNNVPFVPIAGYKIEYTNAFGWYWLKELTGGQLQWKVGVSKERGKGAKAGGGLIPTPATISINTEATATAVPYWGYKNLAGLVKVANGPSVKGSFHGFGAKSVTGGIISLEGSGGRPGARWTS